MHFFWRHGKHPMVICNFPWFPTKPEDFDWMSSHCGVHQLDFGSLHGQQGENLTGWETTKASRVAPDGGTVVPLFNHFTTKKNNDIFRSCGCSCCIGTSKMVLFKIDRSRWWRDQVTAVPERMIPPNCSHWHSQFRWPSVEDQHFQISVVQDQVCFLIFKNVTTPFFQLSIPFVCSVTVSLQIS